MRYVTLLFCMLPVILWAQGTATQLKALNAYVDYANHSSDEVAGVVEVLTAYYSRIHPMSNYGSPKYISPVQLQQEYYWQQVSVLNKNLGATTTAALAVPLKEMRDAEEKISIQSKALDTYHQLEDYKQDKYAAADGMINALQTLIMDYNTKRNALQAALERVYKKIAATVPAGPYKTADEMMRREIERERKFIDSWTYNINDRIHTGWPVDLLEKSILDGDAALANLKKVNPTLRYPAESVWPRFQEDIASIVESKRNGLNNYNFEAKKSDEHSNRVYLNLINYFNGTLVTDYNSYLGFAASDNYFGLKEFKYLRLFEVRSAVKSTDVSVKPFKDIPRAPVTMAAQKVAIPKTIYGSLLNYVDFINETYYAMNILYPAIANLSADAAYYKNLETFKGHGGMRFDYRNYKIPLAEYQKAVANSKTLPPSVAKSLNDQSEVIVNILKELDELSAALTVETAEKRYEQDRLARLYQWLERQKVLYDLWDEKKEILYNDVRKVFDAYPSANPASSWQVSGNALRKLATLNHDALFIAKDHYSGKKVVDQIAHDDIDATLRDVISKEFTNMKGIEQLGSYNGNDPYSPYEDIPKASKYFSELLAELKPVGNEQRYQHPYYKLQYQYNIIVRDFNKFAELSKIPLLPIVYQPEMLTLKSPKPSVKKNEEADFPLRKETPQQSAQEPADPVVTQRKKEESVKPPAVNDQAAVMVVKEKELVRDTVYVERVDTIYMSDDDQNLRSMDGYAINHMVLLLDVSGSMNAPEKLPLLKASVMNLLSMMRQEDKVSIIAFSAKPRVLLEAASFKDEQKITKAIDDLKSSGKTDGNAAVKLAYKVADDNYIRGGNNRIVLATDGQFATREETTALIKKFSGEDIFLTVFNFGVGVGASKELENLAAMGKGNYAYISKQNVELRLIREVKAKKAK